MNTENRTTTKTPYATVAPDHARAAEVFPEMLRVFRARRHPFTAYRSIFGPPFQPASFPEDRRFRANYHLALCLYMKGQVESPEAHSRLSRLAVEKPELFDPRYWSRARGATKRVERLVVDLKERGLGTGVDRYHQFHWPFNYRKVERHWGGDPRNLYRIEGGWRFEEFLGRVRNKGRQSADSPDGLFGFQIKMAAMLAHFGVVVGSIDPVAMPYPLPVDIHVARFLLNTGVLKVTRSDGVDPATGGYRLRYGQTVRAGVDASLRWLRETGENSFDLAEAVWNGSMETCAWRPSDWRTIGERNGRATVITCEPVPDTDAMWVRYQATCLACAFRGSCNRELSIGSKPYFLHGVVEARPSPFPDHWPEEPGGPLYVPPTRTVGQMSAWWSMRADVPYEPAYRLRQPKPELVQDEILSIVRAAAPPPALELPIVSP
jgi:hypothetical protein